MYVTSSRILRNGIFLSPLGSINSCSNTAVLGNCQNSIYKSFIIFVCLRSTTMKPTITINTKPTMILVLPPPIFKLQISFNHVESILIVSAYNNRSANQQPQTNHLLSKKLYMFLAKMYWEEM